MPYEFKNDREKNQVGFNIGFFFILACFLLVFFMGFWLGSITNEAFAYPYNYYNGYYERPAHEYMDNFYYYDYVNRPTYYEYWEWTIDWDDSDNWNKQGLPIIKNYYYNVYTHPIPQYDGYWVDTFIYGYKPYTP